MRFFLILSIVFEICLKPLYAQNKSLINAEMLGKWPSVYSYVIVSPDGRYVSYVIRGSTINKSKLVLQSLFQFSHKIEFICADRPEPLFFSSDGGKLCWRSGDSVFLVRTDGKEQNKFLGAANSVSYPSNKKVQWIVYGNGTDGLRLLNLLTGKEKVFAKAQKADWSEDGKYLILSESKKQGLQDLQLVTLAVGKEKKISCVEQFRWSPNAKYLLLVRKIERCFQVELTSLIDRQPKIIWKGKEGESVSKIVYNTIGERLAFAVIRSDNKEAGNTIWYYEPRKTKADLLVGNTVMDLSQLCIIGPRNFSSNGRWLVLSLRKHFQPVPVSSSITTVDIWSYCDKILNPSQSLKAGEYKDYAAVISIEGGSVIQLEYDEDEDKEKKIVGIYDNHAIVNVLSERHRRKKLGPNERVTNLNKISSQLLCLSLTDRISVITPMEAPSGFFWVSVSPTGRWLYRWDTNKEQYSVIEPQTGSALAITAGIKQRLSSETDQGVIPFPVGIAGWIKNDEAVLIYDNYDIWWVDPSGKQSPINLTGGYGQQHGIKFRFVDGYSDALERNEELLLTAYNRNTGENGFFKLRLNRPGIPELLTMGPYTYYIVESQKEHGYSFGDGMRPVGGGVGKKRRWVVLRQSENDYPNLFVTSDFKSFRPLTDLQPHKKYNWLTTERITWTMPNGMVNRGILYEPENFDSTKKYPVIFNYYEKLSHRQHQFPQPDLTTDNINIPWFVSRGYLVCTPDIQYTVAASPGGYTAAEAATMAVVSAARHLGQRSYIDTNRMAIQGHSFGGYQTNGIITQTGFFAAAAEMAGTSDWISSYLSLVGKPGKESTHKQDHPQGRMGATPWERRDLYLQSPVLNAHNATTPLFIAHNKKDRAVHFNQGVEMYIALRRLSKPCWLLQYDNSGHSLDTKEDALDYTIRLTQYFDHYLKHAPAPQWMTLNSFAPYKGKNNFYELDPAGNCSDHCKVCKYWNEKSKTDPAAVKKEIEQRKKAEHWQ